MKRKMTNLQMKNDPRSEMLCPDIAAQAVFKPLLRIETDDAKDGHKL